MKKLLALLLCLALAATALISCGSDPDPTPDPAPETDPVTYDEIIAKYTSVLTAAKDGTDVAAMERTDADTLGEDVMNAIYDTVAACADPDKMGYGTKDIDGDGTDELLLMSEDGTAYALFTQKNGSAVLLIDLGAQGAIDEEGNIYKVGYDSETATSLSTLCRLQNGTLTAYEYGEIRTTDDTGVHFSYFKTVNGERITIEESEHDTFFHTYFSYSGGFSVVAKQITRHAHFRYVSAFEKEPDGTAFTVDYSSYDAVLETYKKIVSIPSEAFLLWESNGLRHRFITDNSKEYEYTDRLLAACIVNDEGGALSFGYAKKDLNGDGSDELMLMTEEHKVFAVFTLQKGKPALLYTDNGGYSEMLIAPDGKLHCMQYMYAMDRAEVEILSITADGKLQTEGFYGSYIQGYNNYYYKMENGLRVPATAAEANTVRELYKSFVEYGSQAELSYLKYMLALPYTPLDGDAPSLVEADTVWSTSSLIIGAQQLTVTALDEGSVSFVLAKYDWDTDAHVPVLTATAQKNGDSYAFETAEAAGTIELGISGIWLNITYANEENDSLIAGLRYFCTLVP